MVVRVVGVLVVVDQVAAVHVVGNQEAEFRCWIKWRELGCWIK